MQKDNKVMQADSGTNERPRVSVARFFLLTLLGMIALQAVSKHWGWSSKWQTPGAVRGDLAVQESCLRQIIGSWKMSNFSPPGEPEEGQYWWSHNWNYTDGGRTAVVSMDQAGWVGWHELSQCYTSAGWTLQSREIRTSEDDDWSFVLSKFDKPNGLSAVLVFSMCHVDGLPIDPWDLNLRESSKHVMTLADLLKERSRHASDRNVPAIQCQVFSTAMTSFSTDHIRQLTTLHLETRAELRREALRQRADR